MASRSPSTRLLGVGSRRAARGGPLRRAARPARAVRSAPAARRRSAGKCPAWTRPSLPVQAHAVNFSRALRVLHLQNPPLVHELPSLDQALACLFRHTRVAIISPTTSTFEGHLPALSEISHMQLQQDS